MHITKSDVIKVQLFKMLENDFWAKKTNIAAGKTKGKSTRFDCNNERDVNCNEKINSIIYCQYHNKPKNSRHATYTLNHLNR